MVDTMLLSDCTHNNSDNYQVRKETIMLSENAKQNKMKYINSYKKNNYKRIPLEVKISYYEDVLLPAAEEKGITVSAFVKEAISEKLERESKG